ncbi:histidinol-phosphate transaminase [Porticoccus sp. W117]|uniref:histidinol-phosphate transaminase n=1 Tax=Porticoccus sp. W117 TaxID=3054777 RepID=UPI002599A447|nr:histidinol-phosphate transaminase [Porticoccus sp. W117]MDM3870406.1 histidinol-phosphate transaminase [Porticoccus sp. W117]
MASIEQLAVDNVRQLTPYQSARRIGGNGDVWLNANEAPAAPNLTLSDDALNRYPEPQPEQVLTNYAAYAGIGTDQLLVSRGADEAIELLIRTFCGSDDNILYCPPTYGMYTISAQTCGVGIKTVPLTADWQLDVDAIKANLDNVKLVFVCSPNNPTGNLLKREDIEAVIQACAGRAIVVVDEAYIEFSPEANCVELINQYDNVAILRTLSKAFGLAGLRCGFALASAEIIGLLLKVIAPYPIPVPIADLAAQALTPAGINAMQQRVAELNDNRQWLLQQLEQCPDVAATYPGAGNYLLARFHDAPKIFAALSASGVIVRDQSKQLGLDGCLRFTVGEWEELERVVDVLVRHSREGGNP